MGTEERDNSDFTSRPQRGQMQTEMKTGWMARLRVTARGIWGEFRANGLRGVVRVYGWKLLLGVFLFYLIRDTILYILIPLVAGTAIWKVIFP